MSAPMDRVGAYVDGELDAAARAAFEAEMAADPALAARVAAHRALGARLAAAYAPVLDEPVPMRLTAAAQAANDPGPRGARSWSWTAAGSAIAASLVVGVLAGRLVLPPAGPLATTPNGLAAQGRLAQALTRGLAADTGPIRVGLTFRDGAGHYCRTFQSRADALAGLACRDGDRWAVRATATFAEREVDPQYRTAGSETPPAILAAVDQLRAGDPLDAAAERAARDAGWR